MWNSSSLTLGHITPGRGGMEGPIGVVGHARQRRWQGYSRTQCIHDTSSQEREQKNLKLFKRLLRSQSNLPSELFSSQNSKELGLWLQFSFGFLTVLFLTHFSTPTRCEVLLESRPSIGSSGGIVSEGKLYEALNKIRTNWLKPKNNMNRVL